MMTRRALLELATLGTAAAAAGSGRRTALHPAETAVRVRRSGTVHRCANDADSPRQHHQAYVDNLNKAVGADATLSKLTVEELLQRLDTLPRRFERR